MKIYSMTATFGKLEHSTLTLEPGLNIIHAPNEWGKSTWCAFLVAMLYGIETKERTTKATLADKERYAPWSGSPMSGRIDLQWQGKDITIERSSKGRSVFGVFRAYETDTGLEIPELRADNCGQMLLGVEKSVFTRAGFLRLTDLPVTQDESLRRRLNALVTTGDESGTADALAQKLRDLKNRVRANRSSGLLPQAQAQRDELEGKIFELRQLQDQSRKITLRQQELETYQKQLENHQQALEYNKNRAYSEKLAQAQRQEALAKELLDRAQAKCDGMPQADEAEGMLLRLDQLQSAMTALQMDAQLLPEAPKAPQIPAALLGNTAQGDEAAYAAAVAKGKHMLPAILGIIWAVLSLGLLLVPHWVGIAAAAVSFVAGMGIAIRQFAIRKQAGIAAQALLQRYAPLAPGTWVQESQAALAATARYREAQKAYETQRAEIAQRAKALKEENEALTGGAPLSQCRQKWLDARDSWVQLRDAKREHQRALDLAQTLSGSRQEVAMPAMPDTLTYGEEDTARLLSDCLWEQRQLHERLGHCRARMEALGAEEALTAKLAAVNQRIAALEDTFAALEIAQQTLVKATAELQRRFAPQISQRAQALFGKLTGGRYTRLTLAEDLTLHTAAEGEDTLHSALWRSDGTADQLYLALRLAVSEALTPEAPLVLDDALARFDDQRLAAALELLREAGNHKQVILFSCHKRELAL